MAAELEMPGQVRKGPHLLRVWNPSAEATVCCRSSSVTNEMSPGSRAT